jgi:hypothetical protein
MDSVFEATRVRINFVFERNRAFPIFVLITHLVNSSLLMMPIMLSWLMFARQSSVCSISFANNRRAFRKTLGVVDNFGTEATGPGAANAIQLLDRALQAKLRIICTYTQRTHNSRVICTSGPHNVNIFRMNTCRKMWDGIGGTKWTSARPWTNCCVS